MMVSSHSMLAREVAADVPPGWVASLVCEAGPPVAIETSPGILLQVQQSRRFALIRARIEHARDLPAASFEQQVAAAYGAIARACHSMPAAHPLRFWNCVPDIHRLCGNGVERYMTFNAGRFHAFSGWFGKEDFPRRVPAASAVGHEGDDLVIHALCAPAPGKALANPRQIAPYRYSRRYGPLPPCFARATIVERDDEPCLILAGGTASIRGEETVHLNNLGDQLQETFDNLAALIAAANGESFDPGLRDRWLDQYRELRVFHPRRADRDELATIVGESFRHAARIELVHAELCRGDLLVEIEGVAESRAAVHISNSGSKSLI
jgi:enamine deaminase RidA (YjgF/YER057c/UK114 family)